MLWPLFAEGLAILRGTPEEMNVKALLYLALLLALTGRTEGMRVKIEPSANKGQAIKHSIMNHSLTKKHYHTKGESDQRTNRMLAWIELSKN